MYVSFFDLFKIGIGPSSSHTMGPLNASNLFIKSLTFLKKKHKIYRIKVGVYGSLALTGKGHGTDLGIAAGLLGYKPNNVTISKISSSIKDNSIYIDSLDIKFNIKDDLKFNYKLNSKSRFSNKIIYSAFSKKNDLILEKTYYSIGGGFVIDQENQKKNKIIKVRYDYNSANKLLEIGKNEGISIPNIIRTNEKDLNKTKTEREIDNDVLSIWKEMNKSIYKGMQETGQLSGKMQIKKRANYLYKRLIKKDETYDPLDVLDWVNIFAIAVSEENASFGRVVTAPTNGAAGIIPAVIKYYIEFTKESNDKGIIDFLLTASAIGGLYKNNASISGADAGCQGEVGVACSMAAAGLTSALGGTNEQIENAAEIAMEHNLGLTCDPINGMVQIPCIERNAMGAIKAINASRISLNGSGEHKVSLDEVIKTMWETGKNMNEIYKETSKGGLAVNVSEC
ncbi:MAG: L-serine ammonia-lyase [Candidatus Marinimicrobia bacterium]|nr:L-serine ammonia-lyase [Candidatus Neomarinimicrobiota bacterium]|tara:strand:+ start:1505 stop:2863 length:1359 start_codon:yes stop_codon:yes gene_type:complete